MSISLIDEIRFDVFDKLFDLLFSLMQPFIDNKNLQGLKRLNGALRASLDYYLVYNAPFTYVFSFSPQGLSRLGQAYCADMVL